MTQNLIKHKHESHSSPSEWHKQETLHTKGIFDIEDFDKKIKKLKDKGIDDRIVDWGSKIVIPLISLYVTASIAILGWQFKGSQEDKAKNQIVIDNAKTEMQAYVNRATQASGTRQQVLTNYSNRISDLVLEKQSEPRIRDIAKGETLIALRRLDDDREVDKLMSRAKDLIPVIGIDAREALDVLDGFNDANELKGLLVRFLFESDLLTRDNQIVDLSGANITRVNLNYAPLPDINLKGAWLTWGTFLNADLRRANLSRTDLKEADLRGANLQGADLTDAKLQKADLREINLQTTDGTVSHSTNLTKADLRGADLNGAQLSGANLSGSCHDDNTMGLSQQHKKNMRYATEKERDIPCKDL